MKILKNWDDITPSKILVVLLVTLCIVSFLTSCVVYEGSYTNTSYYEEEEARDLDYLKIHYAPIAGLYYYNNSPYWGYYSGYYYYYGYRHIYPWWYYYNYTPSYYYSVTTHVHCHIGNNGYVYRPRGNWRHDNKKYLKYNRENIQTTGINVKNNSNVPTKWRNNSVKVNNRSNVKVNTKPNTKPNNTIKINTNKTNKTNTNKVNINRNNTKTNVNKTNTKINVKKNNNRSNIKKTNINRQNKSNTRNNSNRRPK